MLGRKHRNSRFFAQRHVSADVKYTAIKTAGNANPRLTSAKKASKLLFLAAGIASLDHRDADDTGPATVRL